MTARDGERQLGDARRRMVGRETLVAMIGNAALAVIVVWALFHGLSSVPVLALDGGAFGVVPGTFLFTLGLTLGLSLAIRGRIRNGVVAPLSLGARRRSHWLPDNLALRAVLLALVAELFLVPLTWTVLAWTAPVAWSFSAVLLFNVAYFVVLAGLVVPVVAWRALRDGA